jgi:hypothetical protein
MTQPDSFVRKSDPETSLKNTHKAAFEDVGKAVGQFFADYIAEKVRKLDKKTRGVGDSGVIEGK